MSSYVNVEEALDRLRGNRIIYKKLLGTFLESTTCDDLAKEMEAGDADAAAKSAHTIKGVAGNLSLTALYEESISLEEKIHSGSDLQQLYPDFRKIWDDTAAAVKETIETL